MSLLNPCVIPFLHLGDFNGFANYSRRTAGNAVKCLSGKTYLDPASQFLCISCLIDLPWYDPVYHCQKCGNRFAEPNYLRCHECLEDVQNIDESRSGFVYNEIVRDWILQLKFFVQYHLSSLLGRL